jgi:prepilin peptidase CpaA
MLLIVAVLLTALMLTVILTDASRFIIPNWLVLTVVALYAVSAFTLPIPDRLPAVAIGLATLVFGIFVLFQFKIMGGGDVKLLAATAFFAGKTSILPFLVGVGLLGGLVALVLLLLRPFVAYAFSRLENPPKIPRVLTTDEPVPYGIAIAIAFLMLLWSGKLPGLALAGIISL